MDSPRTSVLIILLVVCSLQAYGQYSNDQISGSWMGILNAGTVELRIGFNVSLRDDLSWSATLDSPDQGNMGIPP